MVNWTSGELDLKRPGISVVIVILELLSGLVVPE